jgi:hypothetical protein
MSVFGLLEVALVLLLLLSHSLAVALLEGRCTLGMTACITGRRCLAAAAKLAVALS